MIEHVAAADGTRLAYRIVGDGPRNVVLIHSLALDGSWFERFAGERERERVAHRLRHVAETFARRRRAKDDVAGAGLGDDDPRIREERDAAHVARRAAAATVRWLIGCLVDW